MAAIIVEQTYRVVLSLAGARPDPRDRFVVFPDPDLFPYTPALANAGEESDGTWVVRRALAPESDLTRQLITRKRYAMQEYRRFPIYVKGRDRDGDYSSIYYISTVEEYTHSDGTGIKIFVSESPTGLPVFRLPPVFPVLTDIYVITEPSRVDSDRVRQAGGPDLVIPEDIPGIGSEFNAILKVDEVLFTGRTNSETISVGDTNVSTPGIEPVETVRGTVSGPLPELAKLGGFAVLEDEVYTIRTFDQLRAGQYEIILERYLGPEGI